MRSWWILFNLRHNVVAEGTHLIGPCVMKIVIRRSPTKYGVRLRFSAVHHQMLGKDCAGPRSKTSAIRLCTVTQVAITPDIANITQAISQCQIRSDSIV